MHLKTFRVHNFRRLLDVRVELDGETTIFVGANNSGKTSAPHVFRAFLGKTRGDFQIYDFSASCWAVFDAFDPETGDPDADLPRLTLDLWFELDEANLHRVIELLPDLDWKDEPVGVRLEYAPKDGKELVERYAEAKAGVEPTADSQSPNWRPWPHSMTDFLSRRLKSEYEIRYFVLDRRRCDDEFRPEDGYQPVALRTPESGDAKFLDSLIRVDFLNAQRYLSDAETHGRDEELSKRLGRFYARNLEKHREDVAAISAVADAEARLNQHFAEVFKPTLDRLAQLGYPGLSDPDLLVKASLDAGSILNGTARVFYDLPALAEEGANVSLPDQYNGLGFKNLIYMVVEVLDFYYARTSAEDDVPPVHLVMIEEPETHLHAQLQQVFIRKIREVLPDIAPEFATQMVITTHSAHIIYERSFQHIRYFRRRVDSADNRQSEVRDLSIFYDKQEKTTRSFLLQYLKLTHCDLFFADGSVLVEGNVERLLVPLIIEKDIRELRSRHLTILEVGGHHAHRFEKLVEFLGLPTLLITDLDSMFRAKGTSHATACMTTQAGAVTGNPTLKSWLPKREPIDELVALATEDKCPPPGNVRVAFQTQIRAEWGGETRQLAGRTFEEAFALQNLAWSQDEEQQSLGLRIKDAEQKDLAALHQAIYDRVRSGVDKTAFALAVIDRSEDAWVAPEYIVEGLKWMASLLVGGAAVGGDGVTVEVPVTE